MEKRRRKEYSLGRKLECVRETKRRKRRESKAERVRDDI